jgi:anaerobic magnesium-protoporphyrin IX monomethyl ester cyclase
MKSAGCTWAGFGVESGDDDIIAAMNKGVTRDRIKNATAIFHKVGLKFSTFFIIGHPGETAATVWRSIKFAAELNADRPAFGVMVPYPGTEIWEMAVKGEGGYKTLSTNWDDYNKQLGNAVELEKLSRRQMEMLQVAGYLYCYIFNRRFRDAYAIVYQHRVRIFNVLKKVLLGRLASRSTQSGYIPESIESA